MTKPIFVASPTDVHHFDKALSRLEHTNDTRFETEDGVLKVDASRWQVAQAYERYSWLTHNVNLTTDRNEYHAEQFNGYADLPDDLGKVVELGCGPFTNLRLILPGRKAASVHLVDPLAKDYQAEHPHCTYTKGYLETEEFYRNPDSGRNIVFTYDVTVIPKAIENWKTQLKFDTLVMVNVLPHCRDACAVFNFIRKRVKVGGLVVLGEFPREHPAALHYDAGHPIALRAHIVDSWLDEFAPIYRNGYYFIGRVV